MPGGFPPGIFNQVLITLLVFSDLLTAVFQCRVRRRQAGDRDTERRAGNIIIADHVAPLNGLGVAAMLATDAHLQFGAGLATIVNRHLHQLAYAVAVQGLERVLGQDSLGNIGD